MSSDEPETGFPADRWPPPPRAMATGLRLRLMTGTMVLVGSIAMGITGFLATLDILATDLPGRRLLAADRREAPGEVEKVERTGVKILGRRIYRYRYSFTLPDGTLLHGVSYAARPTIVSGPKRLRNPAGRPHVTIEYHPAQPGINRLKGTHTGFMPAFFLPMALIPLPVAGAVLVAGLRRGRRRIRLLTDGSAAEATLEMCRPLDGQSRPMTPFPVWRDRWESFREPGDHLPIDPEALTLGQRLVQWMAAVMGYLFTPLFVSGIIVLVLMLGLTIFGKEPMRINGQPVSRGLGILFLAVFLTGWIGIWRFVFHDFPQCLTAAPRGGLNPRLTCTFAFRLPDGQVIETSDDVVMNDRLGASPTEPALYDPDDPRRALLPNGLVPPVQVDPFGAWAAAGETRVLPRVLIAVLCPVAGPLIAWLAWSLA